MGQTRVLSARLKVVFLTIVIPTAVRLLERALNLNHHHHHLDADTTKLADPEQISSPRRTNFADSEKCPNKMDQQISITTVNGVG